MAKARKKYKPSNTHQQFAEPEALYRSVQRLPAVADFPYKKFEKIAAKVPFTQKEWASILHLSERTLQRYSKENKSFEGIYTDRILQIEQLIKTGLETFINADALYQWLKKDKNVLGHQLNFASLNNAQGIQDLIDQLYRIQYGVYT
jgi:uncharacterized protein (DUF2384 family)